MAPTSRLFFLAVVAFTGLSLSSRAALAQATAPSSPLRPPPLLDLGDDRDALTGLRLSSPIRLTLEGAIAPKAGLFPQCSTLEDDVGNSVGGIPVQHYRAFHLVPRLILSVFTQLGCPIDGGIGAALTYEVPIRDSVALVLSAGAYTVPAQAQLYGGWSPAFAAALRGAPSSADAAARADMTWKTSSGQPLSVGVEKLGTGLQGLRFSGGF
jgi:hypothetical protein